MNRSDPGERHLRIRALFEELSELTPGKRTAFLDSLSGKDASLRTELERLLSRTPSADLHFNKIERDILDLGKDSLRKNPGMLEVWLDYQAGDELAWQERLKGTVVSHFEVLDLIGKGGMGAVYRAKDLLMDRIVALKFLPPTLYTDEAVKQRFIDEAKTASSLQHPNIATIHEIGETDDKQIFIVMTYYPGEILKDRIARGPLDADTVLDYARQLSSGLAEAHEHGIIHRDIKPGNILVGEDGRIRLLDFGLAEFAGTAGLRNVGSFSGTVPYMSPEQVRGDRIDARSDIWSVGVVLLEMLTGTQLFQGDKPADVFKRIIEFDLAEENLPGLNNADAPVNWKHILSRCLARDPTERFANSRELSVALYRSMLRKGQGVRKKRLVLGVAALAFLSCLVAGYHVTRVPEPLEMDYLTRIGCQPVWWFVHELDRRPEWVSIVEDPFDQGQGKVLMLNPGRAESDMYFKLVHKRLPEEARNRLSAAGGPATFYFKLGRLRVEGFPGEVDFLWSLASEEANPTGSPIPFLYPLVFGQLFLEGEILASDGDRYTPLHKEKVECETYYELWYVVDYPRQLYDLYIRGGTQFPEPTRVLSGGAFATKATDAIEHLVLVTTSGDVVGSLVGGRHPGYLDDFYIYPDGENLQVPDKEWILLDNFEEGLSPEWHYSRADWFKRAQ